jgi:PIN domain nuclease of toxin-antitoxin system
MRRIQFKPSFREWADSLTAQPGFALAPLDADVVNSALSVQLRLDAFDVGILATARAKNLPLITKDTAITESQTVDVLW